MSDDRAARRKTALERVARSGNSTGAEAKRIIAEDRAAKLRKAEADQIAALPKSIAEAKGDVRAFGKADMQRQAAHERGEKPTNAGRSNMERLLRQQGVEPVRPR